MWIASIRMRTFRIQYDGRSLHCLLCLLYYDASVSWICDHRACISLGGKIGTDTAGAGCRRVEITVSREEHAHKNVSRISCEIEDFERHACKLSTVGQLVYEISILKKLAYLV